MVNIAEQVLEKIHKGESTIVIDRGKMGQAAASNTKAHRLLKFEGLIRMNSDCRLIVTLRGENHIAKHGYKLYPPAY